MVEHERSFTSTIFYMQHKNESSFTFADNLRRVMDEKKLNNRQLALRSGLTATSIGNYLKGNVAMIWAIKRIADALSVPVAELLGADELGEQEKAERQMFARVAQAKVEIKEQKLALLKMARDLRRDARLSGATSQKSHELADEVEQAALEFDMRWLNYGEEEIEKAVAKLRKEQASGNRTEGEFNPANYEPGRL